MNPHVFYYIICKYQPGVMLEKNNECSIMGSKYLKIRQQTK